MTDHHSLQWLLSLNDLNSKLARLSLILQSYTFKVKHRSSIKHSNADAMTRPPFVSVGTTDHKKGGKREEKELVATIENLNENLGYFASGNLERNLETETPQIEESTARNIQFVFAIKEERYPKQYR